MSLFAVAAVLAMLGRDQNGFTHMEKAAFLVQDAAGNVTAVEWPSSGLPDTVMWVGPIPENAIAIAHTHPDWCPRPSTVDVRTARAARMPVYVVTKTQVWQTAAGVTFRIQ